MPGVQTPFHTRLALVIPRRLLDMVTTGGAPRATIFGHLKGVRVEYCRYDSDR